MGKIVKNYLYNIVFQMLVLIIPLVLSPYLVRVLGAEKLGVFAYITSTGNVFVTVGLLGTYNYGCRQIAYYRDDYDEVQRIYSEILSLRLLLGAITTIAYFVVSIMEREYTLYFTIYYMAILAVVLDLSWLFVGQEDMKPTVIKNSIIKLSSVIIIFLTIHSESDFLLYVLIMGGCSLMANLMLFPQARKYINKYRFSLNDAKIHIKKSLAYFWPQVASLLYLQVDKIMLRYLSPGIQDVSFYDYGEKIVTIPLTFITVLSTVMMPRIANEFAKQNNQEVKKLLNKAGSFSLMLAIPMMFGMMICAKDLIPWYLGDNYSLSIYVIIVVSPIIVMNSLSGISGNQYFVATNQMGIVLKAYGSAAISNICINAILIPSFGCVGAGVATSVAATISVIIQYYYLSRQIGIKYFLECSGRYFVKVIPMVIIVLWISVMLPASYVTSIIEVGSGCAIYGLTLLISKDENVKIIIAKLRTMFNRSGYNEY